MILLELFIWWYGPGWLTMFERIGLRVQKVARIFAIPTLLKTLFSPWKRIVTSGAKGIDAKMRAMLDNLVSRTIGFIVRIMVLLAAIVSLASAFIIGVVIAVAWPLIPASIVYFLIAGVM